MDSVFRQLFLKYKRTSCRTAHETIRTCQWDTTLRASRMDGNWPHALAGAAWSGVVCCSKSTIQLGSAQLDSTRHDSAHQRLLGPRFSTPARFGSVHSVRMVQDDFFSFSSLSLSLFLSSPWIEADLDLSKSDVTRHVPSLQLAAVSLLRQAK